MGWIARKRASTATGKLYVWIFIYIIWIQDKDFACQYFPHSIWVVDKLFNNEIILIILNFLFSGNFWCLSEMNLVWELFIDILYNNR